MECNQVSTIPDMLNMNLEYMLNMKLEYCKSKLKY